MKIAPLFPSRRSVERTMCAALLALLQLPPAAVAQTAPPPAETYVRRATLDNGLQVVIVRDPLAPVVTEITTYKAGSDQAPGAYPETAHAVEHMVAGRSLAKLNENQLANIWTLLGDNADAQTSQTTTSYYFTINSDLLDVALHVEAERMSGALFLPKEWTDERPAIVNELQGYFSNAGRRVFTKALNALYPGRFDDSKRLPGLAKTTPDILRAFYEKWYMPNNALLVISGDVDPDATLGRVRSIFGPIPKRTVGTKAPLPLAPVKSATIQEVSDLPVPLAFYAWRMPGVAEPEYPVAQIAADVLAGQRGPFAALGYEGKALFAGFQYAPVGTAGVGLAIIASAPGTPAEKALPLLTGALDGYRTNGVPVDLVEAAKRREIASALYRRNSIEGLAFEWTDALTDAGAQSPDAVVDRFRSVTADDVNKYIKGAFDASGAVTGVLTPKPGSKGGSGSTGTIKDSFAPKDAKPVTLPAWAAVLEAPAKPPAPRPAPADFTLPNGLRVIVARTTISPTVTLSGTIRENGDLQAPPGKEGVDDVTSALFPYGTATLDRLAFQKALDDVAVDVSAGSSFSAQAPKEQFDRALDLLADNLLHPAFPPQAFAIVQAQTAQGLQGELTSPSYLAERAMATALYPKGDPVLREATPKTVSSLTAADVTSYYTQAYRPDMTTMVIVGDITPEAARASVERAFGAWTAGGPRPDLTLSQVPPNKAATARVTAAGRTQDAVALSETLRITRKSPDYYPLQLGNAVLGGGFYSTRFYKDLRKNTGLVYSISAGVDAGRYRATYDVNYEASPKNAPRARAIIDRDLGEMGKSLVTPQELQMAKNQIVRSLPLRNASVNGIASGYLRYADLDLPLDEADRAAQTYVRLSPGDVRAAFARWIEPWRFVQVTNGPAGP